MTNTFRSVVLFSIGTIDICSNVVIAALSLNVQLSIPLICTGVGGQFQCVRICYTDKPQTAKEKGDDRIIDT